MPHHHAVIWCSPAARQKSAERSTASARQAPPGAGRTACCCPAPWRARRRTARATSRRAHREPAPLVHGGVVAGVRPVEVTVIRGPASVMMSVSKVPVTRIVTPIPNGAISPAMASAHRSSAPFAGGIRRCRRHPAHPACAGHHDDPPPAGFPHRRQQRLGQRNRAEDRWSRTSAPRGSSASLRPFRPRRCRRCARARTGRRRPPRSPWPRPRPMPESVRSSGTPISRGSSASRTGRLAQSLHTCVDRPHRRDDTPALAVQVRRGREPESPRRAGDDDAARFSHSGFLVRTGRSRRPAARPVGRRAARSSTSTRCPTEVRAGLPVLLVEALRVIDFGFRDTAMGRPPTVAVLVHLMIANPVPYAK